jgi:TonB-dependent starch-binding outer membrane protein SusC
MKISSFTKCSLLLVFIALLQFTAKASGQPPLSIHMKNVEINQVFATLEKESGYHFLFNSRLAGIHKVVDVDAENADIGEVLTTIFAGTHLQYRVLDNKLIVISSTDVAQDRIISGKISNESNEPLAGVSIIVKGQTKGTTSDAGGAFTVSVPDNGVLVISSIGYITQELNIQNQTELNIRMVQSSSTMDQVVVVGYGTQKKIDVTGATATVKGSVLVKQQLLTATQGLQGQVAGVQIIGSGQPGTQPSVRIRGTGSIIGGVEPLYVVDGILTNDITNINPSDIVNVDILKDASSTAIYGSRGANGVIIITTKMGAAGAMKITYTGNVGIQTAAHLVPMANSTQYAAYVSAATYGLTTVTPTGYSTDWYNQILRNAVESNHNVSLSGANDKVKYLFNVGYADDEGIVINNVYKRLTVRSNNEFKLAKQLNLGVYIAYSNENDQIPNLGTAYNDAYRAAPIIPGQVNGKYGNTSLYQNVGNPILDINNQNSKTLDNRLEGTTFLEYKPVSWLTLKSTLGADWDNNVNTVYDYAFAADTNTFIIAGGNQSNLYSNLGVNSSNYLHWVWDNTATFNKQFDNQNLTVLIGTTSEERTSSFNYSSAKGVPPESNLWYIQNANFTLPFTVNGGTVGQNFTRNSYLGRINYSYDNRYLLTANFRADGSSNFPASNRWGYFPSVGVGWIVSHEDFMKNQDIFDLLKIRGSFGKSGNDVTDAGTAGYTSTLLTGLPYYFNGVAVSGSVPSSIVDQNLQWETSKESDVAVEFSILKSRLSGEISYYSKVTSNSLIYVLVPSTLGSYNAAGNAGYVLTNAASVQNKGYEFSLNWRDKPSKDFSYSIGANFTLNQNTVVGLNGGQAYIDGPIGANQPYVTRTDNGHPIGSFYVQKVLGVFQNQAEIDSYTDKNGVLLQSTAVPGDFKYQFTNGKLDSVYAGSYQPKGYYGVNFSVNYKNFDLSVIGYGTEGGVIYNGKKAFRQSLRDNVESATEKNMWTPSNPTNSEPRANGGSLPASTYFVESGSFFRINNLNIGYTIPAAVLAKTNVIKGIRVYFSGQNIVTITKYSGFSPEIQALNPPTATNQALPVTSSPTNAGIELQAYPSVKTYSMGLNIDF